MRAAATAADLKAVTVTIEGRHVLRNFSLRVAPGDIVAVLGYPGCGKSALLDLLNGTIAASTGTAAIFGAPPGAGRRDVYLLRSNEFGVCKRTIQSEVELAADSGAVRTRAGRAAVVADAISALGLTEVADLPPARISDSNRAAAAIAAACARRPRLLLMDGMLAQLPDYQRATALEYLRGLGRAAGLAVVFAECDANTASMADTVALIHSGSPAAVGAPAYLLATVAPSAVTLVTNNPGESRNTWEKLLNVTVEETEQGLSFYAENPELLLAQAMRHGGPAVRLGVILQPTLWDVLAHCTRNSATEPIAG